MVALKPIHFDKTFYSGTSTTAIVKLKPSGAVTSEGFARPWVDRVFGTLTFQVYIDPVLCRICTSGSLGTALSFINVGSGNFLSFDNNFELL